MSTLTLRDLDDAVIAAIRERAVEKARTVEAEAADILVQAVRPSRTQAELWDEVETIAAMMPRSVTQTDSVAMLRNDRDG